MNQTLILYPSIAMFVLTAGCILYMGLSRFRAIQKREIPISYYRAYNKGEQPLRLHLLGRHVQNHFEVPPLFHLGVILAFVTQSVSTAALVFAWLYVGARMVHTYIHLGSNNVTFRFTAYGFSLLLLCGLWGETALSIAGRSA